VKEKETQRRQVRRVVNECVGACRRSEKERRVARGWRRRVERREWRGMRRESAAGRKARLRGL
jgi:hypothetical protein